MEEYGGQNPQSADYSTEYARAGRCANLIKNFLEPMKSKFYFLRSTGGRDQRNEKKSNHQNGPINPKSERATFTKTPTLAGSSE
jgi:hypothetical protein